MARIRRQRCGVSCRPSAGEQRRMERMLDEISFEASDLSGQQIDIDAQYVRDKLADVVKDEDLTRYIL